MKNLMIVSLIALMTDVATAAGPSAQVLSAAEFDAGGVKVKLEKTIEADGNVCQQYVSSAVRRDPGSLQVTVAKLCDKPIRKSTGTRFPDEVYPAKLSAMRVVTSPEGLVHQEPVYVR